MTDHPLSLPEARNVAGFTAREALLRRIHNLRRQIQIDVNTIEHWNRLHPDEPISADFERAMLDYIDGNGPMPEVPRG